MDEMSGNAVLGALQDLKEERRQKTKQRQNRRLRPDWPQRHVAGPYLLRFAQEASWREDNRRLSNGEQVNRIAGLAMVAKQSVDFCGNWQRHLRVAR
jgi:hypothetical protein